MIEDNYFVWEKLANSGALGQDAPQILQHMLVAWESYADLYASALNKLGYDATRVVPSANVRKTTESLHRLGHLVRQIPTSGRSAIDQSLCFASNILKDLKEHEYQLFHFLTVYSRFMASSTPLLSLLRPVICQYSGGEPPASNRTLASMASKVSLEIALRRCSAVLIDEGIGPELAHQVKSMIQYFRVPRSKIFDFPVVCVDSSAFIPIAKSEARNALGFPTDKVILLCPTSIPKPPVPGLAKNPFLLVDTISKLSRQARDGMRLYVAGHGAGFAELKTMVRTSGLEDTVKLLGLIDHRRLPTYFGASDAVFLPYLCRDLTIGTTVAEAYSSERPALAFRRDAMVSARQPGGFLISSEPTEGALELAEFMPSLPTFKIGLEAKSLAHRYSLTSVARRLDDIYRTVLNV